MNSEFLKLNLKDFSKGLVVAIITGVLTTVYQALQGNQIIELEQIGKVALVAGIGYIIKNLLSDEQGKVGGII